MLMEHAKTGTCTESKPVIVIFKSSKVDTCSTLFGSLVTRYSSRFHQGNKVFLVE